MRLLDFSPLILSMLPSGPGTPPEYQGFFSCSLQSSAYVACPNCARIGTCHCD